MRSATCSAAGRPEAGLGSGNAAAVAQWFATAAQLTGVPSSWIPGLETIGHYESGDDPNAINNWDSNALAGTPSEGIMQVIGPTFAAYHQPGTAMNLLDPVANIAASINYIKARYGDINNVPGLRALAAGHSYVGYDSGGWLMPGDMPVNGLSKPEAVLTPEQWDSLSVIAHQAIAQRGLPGREVTVVQNFNGTQWPSAEQKAAMHRELALALA